MDRDLKIRLVTAGTLLAGVVVAVGWAPGWALAAGCAVVLLAAAREWDRLGGTRLVVPALTAALALVWWRADLLVPWALAGGAAWWVGATVLVGTGGRAWPAGGAVHVLAGLAVLVPMFAALLALIEHAGGRVVVLGALALVWAADTCAYFAGRAFGRRRLAPAISPGKTVEGMVAGLIGAAVVGTGTAWFAGEDVLRWGGLAVLAAALSVVGDLTESLVKRRAGVKDSGRLLPGHGGVLDRIDALTAALPVFALGLALGA